MEREAERKRRVRTEEFRSELPPAGGRTRHRAMGRFRGILRQMRISFEEEMMLLGLPVVSTWLEEAWPPF